MCIKGLQFYGYMKIRENISPIVRLYNFLKKLNIFMKALRFSSNTTNELALQRTGKS